MPLAPKRRCPKPYCKNYQPCPVHSNYRTPRAKEHMAMYNDRRWKAYRLMYLAVHPLCCNPFDRHGPYEAATVVDHIKAHQGDYELFWSAENHRALCGSCNSFAAAKYQGGFGNERKP